MAPPGVRVAVCDKVTMIPLIVYESICEASRKTGRPIESIRMEVYQRRVRKGRTVMRMESDVDPNESFDGKGNRPIKVFDSNTGELMLFCDSRAASEALYLAPGTIRKYALLRETRCGMTFSYAR